MTRVDELTDRLLEGTLTDSEWSELESLLAAEPAARGAHVALLELEGVLRGLRTGFDLSEPTLVRVRETQTEGTAKAVLAVISRSPAPAWAGRRRSTRFLATRGMIAAGGLLAIAAAVVIGLWLGGRPGGNTDESRPTGGEVAAARPIAARLTCSRGDVELLSPQGEVSLAAEGREVPPGHTLRTVGEDSLACVEMPDHTTVDIAPDSVVRFVALGNRTSKPRLFLASGQLTAAVPDGRADRQLVVVTGVAEVFSGTATFVVSSAGPDSTRIDVQKGNVDVVRMDARSRVPVVNGAAFVQAGLDRVVIEPTARIDRAPARSLTFPNPREAVFSPDGAEVWVASPRQLTRWTRDGGTADVVFPFRKGISPGPVVAFTRDKRTLLTSTVMGLPAAREDKVQLRTILDGDDRSELTLKLADSRFWTAAPAAEWLATAEGKPNQKRLRVVDGMTGIERFSLDFEEVVGCLAASADGRLLAVALNEPGRGGNKVVLLEPHTGERLATLPTQKKGCLNLTFSVDGEHLAVGFNGLIQVWKLRTRDLVKSFTGFERVVTCQAFDPKDKLLAVGTQDGLVWVWSLETGKLVQLIDVGARGVRSANFSPDGKRLVVVANNAPVGIWAIGAAMEME